MSDIIVDTYNLKRYAERLGSVNNRIEKLDWRMNSLYSQVGLSGLFNLIQADVLTGYSRRILRCQSYLNQTAADFENAEKELSGYDPLSFSLALDDESTIEEREKKAKYVKWAVTGLCIIGSIAAVAAIVATGGAATPLVVGAISAASGAIIAGTNTAADQYVQNGQVSDWGKVGSSALIGGVSGFISGSIGAGVSSAISTGLSSAGSTLVSSSSTVVRIGTNAVIGSTSNVVSGVAARGAAGFATSMIETGGDVSVSADAAWNAAMNKENMVFDAALGGVTGGIQGIKKPMTFPKKPDGTYDSNSVFSTDAGKFRTDDNGSVYQFYDDEAQNWKLLPNTKYESSGYQYETDSYGRIKYAEGGLRLSDAERKSLNAKVEGMTAVDDRGHIIADRFNASNRNDNLIPQNSSINRGEYKALENEFADVLANGGSVEAKYYIEYDSSGVRPTGIDVDYKIVEANGNSYSGSKFFHN